MYTSAGFAKEELRLETIAVSDGNATARRTFGIGVYSGKPETPPPDFAAVASALKDLARIARANKPCHFGPRVSLGECPFPGVLCKDRVARHCALRNDNY